MVVGTGLIAKAFEEYQLNESIVIFASGVSNSKETSKEAFLRERKLLLSYLEDYGTSKYFIYFSTCSIYDTYFPHNKYAKHKINMEQLIEQKAKQYNIFRLPQVLGVNNQTQLVGFLYNAIKSEEYFDLYDIERNIIDIDDVQLIVNSVIKSSQYKNIIMNIANTSNIKVIDLVKMIEKRCHKKANYRVISKEGSFQVDVSQMKNVIGDSEIFTKNYIESRLEKYYE
jgi:UDP-2-acetamido-2,6-beta-L-arabino-hexul-4-ose reductase